jgi:outer membrane scaffolding protein for murein synthesis (MipA/OmpV family)
LLINRQILHLSFCLAWAVYIFVPRLAVAQTPSPLQEWQYSSGIILEKLFEPNPPDWRVVAGVAAEYQPLYDGAKPYRLIAGPVINIQYKDLYFFSVGEGLGVNIVRGDNYRMGLSLGYDRGRRVEDDLEHLRGLGNIATAPVLKAFGSYVISKDFPLILRADVRQFIGGSDGVVGDLQAYMPLPGSSQKLVMFAGPSFSFASHLYQQTTFGVSSAQAAASGYPVYEAHAGSNSMGLGFSASRFLTKHWIINTDMAIDRLIGSASESPFIVHKSQAAIALSFEYSWQ